MGFGKLQVFVFRHTELNPHRIGIAHGSEHGLPGRHKVAYGQIAGTDPSGERCPYFRIAHTDLRVFQNGFMSRNLGLGGIPLGHHQIILLFGHSILLI